MIGLGFTQNRGEDTAQRDKSSMTFVMFLKFRAGCADRLSGSSARGITVLQLNPKNNGRRPDAGGLILKYFIRRMISMLGEAETP